MIRELTARRRNAAGLLGDLLAASSTLRRADDVAIGELGLIVRSDVEVRSDPRALERLACHLQRIVGRQVRVVADAAGRRPRIRCADRRSRIDHVADLDEDVGLIGTGAHQLQVRQLDTVRIEQRRIRVLDGVDDAVEIGVRDFSREDDGAPFETVHRASHGLHARGDCAVVGRDRDRVGRVVPRGP